MEIELKSMMKDHNASLMSGEAEVEQRQISVGALWVP